SERRLTRNLARNGQKRRSHLPRFVSEIGQAVHDGRIVLLRKQVGMVRKNTARPLGHAPKLTEFISFRETEEVVTRLTAFAEKLGITNPNQAARIAFRAGISAVETVASEVSK